MSHHRHPHPKNHSAHHPLHLERMENRLAMDADGLELVSSESVPSENTGAPDTPEIRFNLPSEAHSHRPLGNRESSPPSHLSSPSQDRHNPNDLPNSDGTHPSPLGKLTGRPRKPSSPPEGEGPFTPPPNAPQPPTLEPTSSRPTPADLPSTPIDRAPPPINDTHPSTSNQLPNQGRDASPSSPRPSPSDSTSLDLRPASPTPDAEKIAIASPNNSLSLHDAPPSTLFNTGLNGSSHSSNALNSGSSDSKSTSTLSDLKSTTALTDSSSHSNVANKPSTPFAIPSPTSTPYASANDAPPLSLRVSRTAPNQPSNPSRSTHNSVTQTKVLEGWSQQAGFAWKGDSIEDPRQLARESLTDSTQSLATFQYFAIGGSDFVNTQPTDTSLDLTLDPSTLDPHWLSTFLTEDETTNSNHPARWLLSSSLFVGSAIWWLIQNANTPSPHTPAIPRHSNSNHFPSRKSRRG